MLASEVAVGLALLAIIVFIAAFTSLIRQAGRDTLATAITRNGAAFVAMGFISQAAETALVGVADAGDQSAVLALNHLQGRIHRVDHYRAHRGGLPRRTTYPAPADLVGYHGTRRRRCVRAWLMSSVLGRTVEGNTSLFGVGLFIVWLLLVAVCLWQAAGTTAPESKTEHQQ